MFSTAVHAAESSPDRDRALIDFLRARIAEAGVCGPAAETKALTALAHVLSDFEENFLRSCRFIPDDYLSGHVDALRWTLQCFAATAFAAHPDATGILMRRVSTVEGPDAA
ncbi:hypothetical protein [Streptomyces zhihengii]